MIIGIEPRLAEGGKIKIGGLGQSRTAASGREYRQPIKLDHFILTGTTRTPAGDLAIDAALTAALLDAGFGDGDGKLRRIPIVMHSNEVDEVFPTTYACYGGRRLACRGDGEKATRFEIKDGRHTGNTKPMPCPCSGLAGCTPRAGSSPCDKFACKPHGTLHCSIALPGHAVAGSVHKWRTTSIISIQQMLGSLAQIRQAVGVLRNVPLQMIVRPATVTPEGQNATTVYVCHLELRAQDVLAMQRNLLEQEDMRKRITGQSGPDPGYRALIAAPASDTETDDEQEEVAAEFSPEPEAEEVERMAATAKLTEKLRGASAPADMSYGPPPMGSETEKTEPKPQTKHGQLF